MFYKLIEEDLNKPIVVRMGGRNAGKKYFFLKILNQHSIFDIEFEFLNRGTTFTIEDGRITDVHFMH